MSRGCKYLEINNSDFFDEWLSHISIQRLPNDQ